MNLGFKYSFFTCLILLVNCYAGNAQDTLSLYYKSNEFKLTKAQHQLITEFYETVDLKRIDSIYFIGYADTIGDRKSNLKLSKKRAKACYRRRPKLDGRRVPIKVKAQGEINFSSKKLSRRVDIILFLHPLPPEPKPIIPDLPCLALDYSLLHRASVKTIKKRRKELVKIEIEPIINHKSDTWYYGHLTDTGSIDISILNWKRRRTGKLWWKKVRYVAYVPKRDFNDYKIFKMDYGPCDVCQTTKIALKPQKPNFRKCKMRDDFLMANIQMRIPWFGRNIVRVRAPREFVDLGEKYYSGCDFNYRLKWIVKKGKRHQNYYYTYLPIENGQISNIVKEVDCCFENPLPTNCDRGNINCATINLDGSGELLLAELATYSSDWDINAYATIGLSFSQNRAEEFLLGGIDQNLDPLVIARYRYSPFVLPIYSNRKFGAWQTPTNYALKGYQHYFVGTDLMVRFSENQNWAEPSIYLGYARKHYSGFMRRGKFFVQAGIGYSVLDNEMNNIYPVTKLGWTIKF